MASIRKPKRISAKLRDELRRASAVYMYSVVYNSARGLQNVEQINLMYDMYHGTATELSNKKMLANGEGTLVVCSVLLYSIPANVHFVFFYWKLGVYRLLYQKEQEGIVTETDISSQKSNLVLKDEFCFGSRLRIGAGDEINETILEQAGFNDKKLITGRALFEMAKSTIRTMKKALAIMTSEMKPGKPFASGNNEADLYKKVLDQMYLLLKGKSAVDIPSNEASSDDSL